MRILVYGAGVLGSYLAHALVRGGNEVTVLARGKRAEELMEDGVVIRHYFQRKTTVDKVNIITELQADDRYDLIFVVMKFIDFPSVLPILANNRSSNIVLVGNNTDTREMQNFLTEKSLEEKNVAFGFQMSGGRREKNGRIICIRGGGQMVLGSLDGPVPFKPLLEKAFDLVKYKLEFHEDINSWLISHLVMVLVTNYAGYVNAENIKKVARDKKLVLQMVEAMDEGFKILETAGYTITPAGQVNFIRKHRRIVYLGLKIFHALPVVKMIDGSIAEIAALNEVFNGFKRQADIATPNWDALEASFSAKYREDALTAV